MRCAGPLLSLVICVLVLGLGSEAVAQSDREVRFQFSPVGRAQVALWVESRDETLFQTVRLTQAVARRGIGNRPGASQMNSGFRWPYGRREAVLPIWAHRRFETSGMPFSRVIFHGRESEGLASVSFDEPRNSRDDYFCLSFDRTRSSRDALDAVTCASVFNSNKGRYMTTTDVERGYAEPYEDRAGSGRMRPLSLHSMYPPRRDVERCAAMGCEDSIDTLSFDDDSRRVMPVIDEVTTATFDAGVETVLWTVPEGWPDGEYDAFLEINVEGDYNDTYGPSRFPTPMTPADKWDYWAQNYGYPFRGQPSIVYRIPLELSSRGVEIGTASAWGYGSTDGSTGAVTPIDATITDDPAGAPGSGADRLGHMVDGSRFRVSVMASNVCGQPEPPPACSATCGAAAPCPEDFICAETGTCVGLCDVEMVPKVVDALTLTTHEDVKEAHRWVRMSFVAPESVRQLARYEVRVANHPIVDEESFIRAAPANAASTDSVELPVPVDVAPGETVEVVVGGLYPELTYWVAIRAVDECNDDGPIAVESITTRPVHFTTVSPCFVATAAHGSPLAAEVGLLRRFRDRHLETNAPGRALVGLYYSVGPALAEQIEDRPWVRAGVRALLRPLVGLAKLAP